MQVLSLVEQFLLMYRTLATVPCWLLYFHSLAMGDILTSGMHGAPDVLTWAWMLLLGVKELFQCSTWWYVALASTLDRSVSA